MECCLSRAPFWIYKCVTRDVIWGKYFLVRNDKWQNIVFCPTCDNRLSIRAKVCPRCGETHLNNAQSYEEKVFSKDRILWRQAFFWIGLITWTGGTYFLLTNVSEEIGIYFCVGVFFLWFVLRGWKNLWLVKFQMHSPQSNKRLQEIWSAHLGVSIAFIDCGHLQVFGYCCCNPPDKKCNDTLVKILWRGTKRNQAQQEHPSR